MPLYEYECLACGKHTEKIQKFSDAEITVCPYCGGTLKRVITAPAFSFQGGGWYKDGYGNAAPPAAAKAEGGEGTGAAKAESGGESAASGEKTVAAAPAANATPATTAAPAAAPAAASAEKK